MTKGCDSPRAARQIGARMVFAATLIVVAMLAPIPGIPGLSGSIEAASAAGRPPVYPGQHPDPEVIRGHDGIYYAYATNHGVFGVTGDANVPVIGSGDLNTWTQLGDAMPTVGSWAEPVGWNWAPSVEAIGGRYVLYYTAHHASTRRFCIGRATSALPRGPFVDTFGAPLLCGHSGGSAVIDPSVYLHGGRVFLYYKLLGSSRQLHGVQLTGDGLHLAGGTVNILNASQPWELRTVENPDMVWDDGRHFLFYSGGSWRNSSYSTGVAVCESALGPCDPITRWHQSDDHASGPGGASIFTTPGGQRWMAYHGWRSGSRQMFIDSVDFGLFGPFLSGRPYPIGPPNPYSPIGSLDVAHRIKGTRMARVAGWTLDRESDHPIDVHVYANERGYAFTASNRRPDVAAVHHRGPRHGYDIAVPLTPGNNRICSYGINIGFGGSNRRLMCRDVELVEHVPRGTIDRIDIGPERRVTVSGWAIDDDTRAPIEVHIYVDGASVAGTTANLPRPDVAAAFGLGSRHGYGVTFRLAPGPHEICAWGLNDLDSAPNNRIACRSVTIP